MWKQLKAHSLVFVSMPSVQTPRMTTAQKHFLPDFKEEQWMFLARENMLSYLNFYSFIWTGCKFLNLGEEIFESIFKLHSHSPFLEWSELTLSPFWLTEYNADLSSRLQSINTFHRSLLPLKSKTTLFSPSIVENKQQTSSCRHKRVMSYSMKQVSLFSLALH